MTNTTFRCKAGKTKTVDIPEDQLSEIPDYIDNYVGYFGENPTDSFLPDCEQCEVADNSMMMGDDGIMHIVKMCNLTKVVIS